MIIGIGTDICDIRRVEKVFKTYQGNFLNKVFTSAEINLCKSRNVKMTECLAMRWCAKEAIVKAMGTGFRNMSFTDVEVLSSKSGAPKPVFYGRARKKLISLTKTGKMPMIKLSLSSEGHYCICFSIIHY